MGKMGQLFGWGKWEGKWAGESLVMLDSADEEVEVV
jgi:hypothetical protein